MAKLAANHLAFRKALNGPRAVHSIAKHPRLYLAADGKGGGSWRIKYYPPGRTSQRWLTISNDARHVAFDEVAQKATELLSRLILHGVDPKQSPPASGGTFDDVFGQWKDRYAKQFKKSWEADVALYHRHIAARLGDLEIDAIDRGRVIAVLNEIAAAATPIQANRCQALISSVLSWALDEGLLKAHPALRIRKRGIETARDQVMRDAELRAFWTALGEYEAHIQHVIKLLLLLGSRLSEVVGIEVRELSFGQQPHWTLPAKRSKNGLPNVVPLPVEATSIMLSALQAARGSSFLFPARNAKDVCFDKKYVSRTCKKLFRLIGREDMRLHDLRHQAATGMARCGVPIEIRQMVQNQVTGRSRAIGSIYDQHDYFKEKQQALLLWQHLLLEVVGSAQGGYVHET